MMGRFRYIIPQQRHCPRYASRRSAPVQSGQGSTAYPLVLANYQTMYEDDHLTLPLAGFGRTISSACRSWLSCPAWPGGDHRSGHRQLPGNVPGPQRGEENGRLLLAGSRLARARAAAQASPDDSPWRVVMVGIARRLVESNIVITSSTLRIADTSWISPARRLGLVVGSQAEGVNFSPG